MGIGLGISCCFLVTIARAVRDLFKRFRKDEEAEAVEKAVKTRTGMVTPSSELPQFKASLHKPLTDNIDCNS